MVLDINAGNFSIVLLCSLSLSAQNLIPNPDFEQYECLSMCSENLECATSWLNPTFDTPDFLHRLNPQGNCIVGSSVGVPRNWLGVQEPHSGDGYIGIHTYTFFRDANEYAMVQLKEPLYAGQTYDFSMYVSHCSGQRYFTNGLGILLKTEQGRYSLSYSDIFEEPLFFVKDVIYNTDWTLISTTFTADAPYEYLIIGRFLYPDDPRFIVEEGDNPFAFGDRASYFIDDVSLIPREVPPIDIGPDMIVCSNFLFSPALDADSYLWSTGERTSSIVIQESGDYWLEISRFGQARRDTVRFDVKGSSVMLPNPSNGMVHIKVTSEEDQQITWQLHDIQGRLVWKGNISVSNGTNTYSINLSMLSDGVYFSELRNPCGEKTMNKIIIQKL